MPLGDFEGSRLGASGCHPVSPVIHSEVKGTTTNGELYGLIMTTRSPIRVGDEVKIVWRMTGTGDLRATLDAPDGEPVPLAWGPDEHSGSNYVRPGDEWGVGYVFDRAGCWHLGFARSDTGGDVWLQIDA